MLAVCGRRLVRDQYFGTLIIVKYRHGSTVLGCRSFPLFLLPWECSRIPTLHTRSSATVPASGGPSISRPMTEGLAPSVSQIPERITIDPSR